MTKTVKTITYAAVIAAIYAALTFLFSFSSYGLIQVRVAEALCVLPLYTSAAVPGLFVGCLIANLVGGMGIWDIVIGSLATLVSALAVRAMRDVRGARFLAPVPCVLFNAVGVGAMMAFLLEMSEGFWVCAASVGAGQLAACMGLGVPLTYALDRLKLDW